MPFKNIPSSFRAGIKDEDGTFARKNVQINRDDEQPVLQHEGDMIIWERGDGYVYDDYNSVIDTSLWDTSASSSGVTDVAEVQETETYIQAYAHRPATGGLEAGAWDVSVETKDLPALADITEVTFRGIFSSSVFSDGELTVFGTVIVAKTDPNDDSIWRFAKQANGDFEIFDDEVSQGTFTPTDNIIKARVNRIGSSTGEIEGIARLYSIDVGGSTFLLIKSTQRTFKITLADLA